MTGTTSFDSPEVIDKVFEMDVGEYATVQSDYGIHIVMRYELEEKGYKEKDNSDFFIDLNTGAYVFTETLQNQLLATYLDQYKEMILVDEEVLAEADIKRIGANLYY